MRVSVNGSWVAVDTGTGTYVYPESAVVSIVNVREPQANLY